MAIAATPTPPHSLIQKLKRRGVQLLAIVGAIAILQAALIPACFIPTRIISPSMSPTLKGTNWDDGDSVLIERMSYWFRAPRRWEIIAFRNEEGAFVLKRAVGLPGERVQLASDGTIYINGEESHRPEAIKDLRYIPVARVAEFRTVECTNGYFVLGDHSMDSDDSRFNPPIAVERVVGRGWFIFGPSDRAGWIR